MAYVYEKLMVHRNQEGAEIFVSSNDGLGYTHQPFYEKKFQKCWL